MGTPNGSRSATEEMPHEIVRDGAAVGLRQANAHSLEEACLTAIQELRGALIELYASAGLEPDAPQEVSRKLKLNKNLTWKMAKVIAADDGLSAIQHLPGSAGWRIFYRALLDLHGVDHELDRVRQAMIKFDSFVSLHAGDRANLELILDSMGVVRSSTTPMEASRELAFRGNSGIWGVQARVRTASGFVVPSVDPEKVDLALVAGMAGFRQLRTGVSWPLFRFQTYSDSGVTRPRHGEPIETPADENDPPNLMRSFCSSNLPRIERRERPNNTMEYCLAGGQVGNLGAFDCYFGDISRGYPRHATEDDKVGEFGSTIVLPVETMMFDLFVHRSIKMPAPPTVLVYGHMGYGGVSPESHTPEHQLPLVERCAELPGSPPTVATTLVARYAEVVRAVQARLNTMSTDFVAFRMVMKYPPMPSTIILRWPLEERPG
ncbi:MAG: hypothetical protein KF768_03330 [Phycisphaeraceae bacterium]|nr:hypothetical protein [Phycisphaeraceae bacterium]